MTEEMRKSEFADLLGVSRAYVSQLSRANRLVLSEDGQRVRVRESLDLISSTGSADKMAVAARHAMDRWKKGGSGVSVPDAARSVAAAGAPPAGGGVLPNPAVLSTTDPMAAYNIARAENEIKRGQDMDIELAKKRGELISREATIKLVADLAAATRATYDRIPDRIATRLAAESEPAMVYALLQEALDAASETLSKQAGEIVNKLG